MSAFDNVQLEVGKPTCKHGKPWRWKQKRGELEEEHMFFDTRGGRTSKLMITLEAAARRSSVACCSEAGRRGRNVRKGASESVKRYTIEVSLKCEELDLFNGF